MSDGDGLCVLTPVRRGHEAALRARLRALPDGPRSPLIRVGGTHFARWSIVHPEDRHGRPIDSSQQLLLFAAEFDGPLGDYVLRLCDRLGRDGQEIWGHCEGCPGGDAEALAGFLLEHRVRPGYSVVAYPGATVEEVRAAFALRERLGDFLIRTAALEPAALQRAWLHRFRGGGR
jgi:hypothetical protein